MTDTVVAGRRAALALRYGTAEADRAELAGELVWNEVLATQLAHRSVRKFLPDSVSEEQLRAIVAAASSAASSSNLQLWSVVAVTDRDRLGRRRWCVRRRSASPLAEPALGRWAVTAALGRKCVGHG